MKPRTPVFHAGGARRRPMPLLAALALSRRFPLQDAARAHELLARKTFPGKIVLIPS